MRCLYPQVIYNQDEFISPPSWYPSCAFCFGRMHKERYPEPGFCEACAAYLRGERAARGPVPFTP